ncbi:MAG TPA: hypothetical protein VFV67_04830 [Actinophytocola sp.]|uniref:hypothetical protein n=1 Tax=Actinophytocola sp. TaxID=1872138 RepID=UPI002DB5A0A4|nr:hypothetical protein [Actinophytocola sp.]HEU5469955.1 hypothetical protein [Actinophytocola sp.]
MGLNQSELELVFAGVPRVGPVEGCTYCYTQAELDQLGADRAGVPDDLVMAFARESDGHWNEEQYGLLWRGLAPRILGLLERWRDEMLLKGLTFARFGTWPEPERSAVRGALRARWRGRSPRRRTRWSPPPSWVPPPMRTRI